MVLQCGSNFGSCQRLFLFSSACRFCSVLPSNSAAYIGRVMAAEDVDCNIMVHLQIRCQMPKRNWNVRDCISASLEIW